MREFLKELYHCKGDWCVWSAMIPFLTLLGFCTWIIPASLSSVQIHFWLVINGTGHFISSLQTNLIRSSLPFLRGLDRRSTKSCQETMEEPGWHRTWGDNVKRASSGWSCRSGNYGAWEQYASSLCLRAQREIFIFRVTCQKLILVPPPNSCLPVCKMAPLKSLY